MSSVLHFRRLRRIKVCSQSLEVRFEPLTNPEKEQQLEDCILEESFQCDTPVLVDLIHDILEIFGMKLPRSASIIDEVSNESVKAVNPMDVFDVLPLVILFS
jgi:hypothetical protein